MDLLNSGLGGASALLRQLLFAVAVVVAIVCALDWLVRTRRISPFSPVARFLRQTVDPLIAPVERMVVKAGGLPTSAPWWALVLVVVGGIIALTLFDFVREQVATFAIMSSRGPRGILSVLVAWTFQILRLALLVRVVCSWVRVSPYSPWVRWAFALSEPILRPLRQLIPPLGMMDISPLVAYFGLGLLQRLFQQML